MTIHKLKIVSHPHGIENIGDVAAYILSACGGKVPMMRLQLLAYYICAWDLAFHTQPLIETEFQAWVHGPVSRDLWNICGISARILSVMSMVSDADVNGSPERLSPEGRVHTDNEHPLKSVPNYLRTVPSALTIINRDGQVLGIM